MAPLFANLLLHGYDNFGNNTSSRRKGQIASPLYFEAAALVDGFMARSLPL